MNTAWSKRFFFVVRIIWVISVVLSVTPQGIKLPMGLFYLWISLAFVLPIIVLKKSVPGYLILELCLSGSALVYTSNLVETMNFILLLLMVGYHSHARYHRWSLPLFYISFMLSGINRDATLVNQASILIGTVFMYYIGVIMRQLDDAKGELKNRNLLLEERSTFLNKYISQVEQVAVTSERSKIYENVRDEFGEMFNNLLREFGKIQGLPDKEKENEYKRLSIIRESKLKDIILKDDLETMEEGLESFLHKMIREIYQEAHVDVQSEFIGNEPNIKENIKLNIFRIIQESVLHSYHNPTVQKIRITINSSHNEIIIKVEDDGTSKASYSLNARYQNLEKRIKLVNGEMIQTPFLDKGYILTCIIPVLADSIEEDRIKILIAEKDSLFRTILSHSLSINEGLHVLDTVNENSSIIEYLNSHLELPDIILCSKGEGIEEIIYTVKENWPDIKIVVLIEEGDVEKAANCIHLGATGILLKNIPMGDMIASLIKIDEGDIIVPSDFTRKIAELLMSSNIVGENPLHREIQKYGLSAREVEILDYLLEGHTYKEISSSIHLAEGTVRNYISNIYSKLGVQNRKEAETLVKSQLIKN